MASESTIALGKFITILLSLGNPPPLVLSEFLAELDGLWSQIENKNALVNFDMGDRLVLTFKDVAVELEFTSELEAYKFISGAYQFVESLAYNE